MTTIQSSHIFASVQSCTVGVGAKPGRTRRLLPKLTVGPILPLLPLLLPGCESTPRAVCLTRFSPFLIPRETKEADVVF